MDLTTNENNSYTSLNRRIEYQKAVKTTGDQLSDIGREHETCSIKELCAEGMG